MISSQSYNLLIQKLDAFIRKYYKNQIIKGFLYCIALGLGFYLTMALLEYFGRFSSAVRTAMFFILIASVAAMFLKFIVIPLIKLFKLGRIISHEEASEIIGNHFPTISDKLTNTLQLKKQADEYAGDPSLLLASIDQRINQLNPVPFTAAIDFKENKKYLKYAVPPLLLLLIILVAAPGILQESTSRLVKYNSEFIPQAPFTFTVKNKILEVPAQGNFILNVELNGEIIPNQASIILNGNPYRLKKTGKNQFEYQFKNVRNDVTFQLMAEGFTSKIFKLKTLPNPLLVNFSVELDYPTYTGLPDETKNNSGNLIIPEGTIAVWKFKTENTDNVWLAFNDTTLSLNQSAKNSFTYSRDFTHNNSYSVNPENALLKSTDSLFFSIDVIKDEYPGIQVEEKADSIDNKLIYFSGIISDDYGIKKLEFKYQFNKTDSAGNNENLSEAINIPTNKSNKDQFFYFWDLNRIKINAGDQITYYFEVWDNDGVNGSKSTRSTTKTYKAPSIEELEQRKEESDENIKKKIEESITEARDLQKEIEEMNRLLLEKKEMNWQDKKKLEELLKKQANLEKNVEQIKEQNNKSNKEQQDFKPQNENLLEKQQQLDKLFNELMSDEMKEMYKELERLMESLDKEKIQEEMEKMTLNQEQLEKELERTLEIFKHMEVEQKMADAIEKLEDLAKEQKDLAEKTKQEEADNEELKKEQSDIEEKFEQLKDDLKALEKKNSELEQPMELPDTKEDEEKVGDSMEQSKEELDQQKNKKASESQQGAGEQMEQMAQKMEQSMQGQQQEQLQEDMAALRALLENIIQLSFDQEGVMEDLKSIRKDDPLYVKLGQKQKKIEDDSQMVEDSLFALSKRIVQIQPIVNKEIGIVNSNIAKAIDDMGERLTPDATNRQQYVMTSYNNLALLLDEALQQMQQAMAKSMPGTGNCEKPGGSGTKPSEGQLSKMQDALSKKLSEMQKAMEGKGQKPGEKPGDKPGSGNQGMSKELAKMAAEQAAIRREVEKLAQELNKQGNGEGNGFKKIAEKMEENEEDLVNKNISRKTIERQKEILTRLLKSEKAQREREYDNQRKSNEAKNYSYSNPKEFIEYKKRKEKEVELLRTVPPSLKPYYRDKVNEYFIKFDE